MSDQYILSRVDFDKSFQADGYREKSRKGLFQQSLGTLSGLTKALGLTAEYVPTGFMDNYDPILGIVDFISSGSLTGPMWFCSAICTVAGSRMPAPSLSHACTKRP